MYVHKAYVTKFSVYVQSFFLHLHGTYVNLACGTHQFISIVVYMGSMCKM
jgi:hypothetical protein